MSTALYLQSSSSNGDEDQEKKLPLEKPGISKRAAKSQATLPKNQRLRCLSIAQLECLRTLTETHQSLPPSLAPATLDLSQNHHFCFAFPVVDPETRMSFAPASYYEAFAEAQIRSQQLALQRYRIANGGGMPLADSRGIFPDLMQLDRCRIQAPEMRFQGRSGFPNGGGTSVEAMMVARELSSSHKTPCLSNQCEVCAKRFQGENLGFQDFGNDSSGGGFMDVATNGGDFLGLNIGSGSMGFGGRGEWRGGSSGMHVDQAYIVGEHGDSSVALWSSISVGGVPILSFLEKQEIAYEKETVEKIHKTIVGSAYEVKWLKGYTSWAIGYSVASLARTLLRDQRRIHPVSIIAKGFYGIEGGDVFLSLPALLGRSGVLAVTNVHLTEEEAQQLRDSAKTILEVQNQLGV